MFISTYFAQYLTDTQHIYQAVKRAKRGNLMLVKMPQLDLCSTLAAVKHPVREFLYQIYMFKWDSGEIGHCI